MYLISSNALIVLILPLLCECYEEVCDRRPLHTKADPLPPDNLFALDIEGIIDNKYIPKTQYKVRLYSRDEKATFIAFTISIKEDTTENKDNPRRPIPLKAGRLEAYRNSTDTTMKPHCNDTVMESDITAKTSVMALWTAPQQDNKCVTIFAVVAVSPNMWYNFEGPLSKRVCEDTRKADDMPPMENDNCRVCEDARYQLVFEGLWSYNTHPYMFPKSHELARFSDVVGASHSRDFVLFKSNTEARPGLKMLAEQGNTTQLELEIQQGLGSNVRTIIKATAPPTPSMSTIASLRVTRYHHLVSVATAMLPSPDWFLGAASLELCDVNTGVWAKNIRLNLYPLDAGTDKGLTFESPNEETSPPLPISAVKIDRFIRKEDIKAFARVQFNLVRTYMTSDCATESTSTDSDTVDISEEKGGEEAGNDNDSNENKVSPDDTGDNGNDKEDNNDSITTQSAVVETSSISPDLCPMTEWGEWQECATEVISPKCIDDKIIGEQFRYRRLKLRSNQRPPKECLLVDDFEMRSCEKPCEEEETQELL